MDFETWFNEYLSREGKASIKEMCFESFKAGRTVEREECAVVAEQHNLQVRFAGQIGYVDLSYLGKEIAVAIRERVT